MPRHLGAIAALPAAVTEVVPVLLRLTVGTATLDLPALLGVLTALPRATPWHGS